MNKRVHVAVGVVLRNGQIFLTKRANDVHQGGKWEFPGGKVEADETVLQALNRELAEEIGIEVINSIPLIVIRHDYTDKQVALDVHIVNEFNGEPKGAENQLFQWSNIQQLASIDFPEANKPIITALTEYFSQ